MSRSSCGGDFNCPPRDAVFRLLEPRLTDAFAAAGRGWGATIIEFSGWPLIRIDQIWTSDATPRDVRLRRGGCALGPSHDGGGFLARKAGRIDVPCGVVGQTWTTGSKSFIESFSRVRS